MGVGKRVKVEILYDTYAGDKLGFSFPPIHRTILHFWGNATGEEYPYRM